MLFVANIFAQTCEIDPNANIFNGKNLKSTDATWTVQFSKAISTEIWGPGTYGIESDGTYLYVTKWASNKFYKLTAAGALVDSFSVTGTLTGGIRDLAFDGTYFYGSNNSNIIYKMDFTTNTIVSSITLPTGFAVRHIAYDASANSGAGGLWCGPWNVMGPRLYSMTGNFLDSIPAANLGAYSASGSACDNVTPGGPYLWLSSYATGAAPTNLIQIKISTKQITMTHDISTEISGLASITPGGVFQTTNLIAGTTTLGGLAQGTMIWGFNHASTIGIEKYINNDIDFNIYPNPTNDNIDLSINLKESKNVEILIYNSFGAVVLNQNQGKISGNQNIKLNLSTLSKGIYYMNVKAGEKSIAKKLVIQ